MLRPIADAESLPNLSAAVSNSLLSAHEDPLLDYEIQIVVMDSRMKDLQSRIERQECQLVKLAFPPPTCQDEQPPKILGFKRHHSFCFGENPADLLPRKRCDCH